MKAVQSKQRTLAHDQPDIEALRVDTQCQKVIRIVPLVRAEQAALVTADVAKHSEEVVDVITFSKDNVLGRYNVLGRDTVFGRDTSGVRR